MYLQQTPIFKNCCACKIRLSAVLAVSMVHTNSYDMILLQNDVPGVQMKCEIEKENTYC
jgi:hypothetical protein